MDTIRIWKGAKRCEGGRDLSNFVFVEFEGESLGTIAYGDDGRGVTYSFYRAADGRVVAHVVRWSDYEDEDDVGEVYVFANLNDAADVFRLHMERVGIIERRTLTLDDLERNAL